MSNRRHPEPSTADLLSKITGQLPYSDEAERGFLSCLLQDPNRIAEAIRDCPPSMLYDVILQDIYGALVYLRERFQPIDPVTIANYLRDNNRLEAVGGSAAISELYTFVPIAAHFAWYRDIILDKHAKRQLIHFAANLIHECQDPETTAAAIGEDATASLANLCNSMQNKADMLPCRSLSAVLTDVLDKAEHRARHPGQLPGLATGFDEIDRRTGGLQEGRMIVVAGETSDGKSTLVQNFVESACEQKAIGIIYSYEMPDAEIAERILCSRGDLSNESLMRGTFTRGEEMAIQKATAELHGWSDRLALIDVADHTIEAICRDIDLRTEIARKADPKAKIVAAIDYLQLAETAKSFGDNRERAVAHISKTAKQCAKRNKITLILPSQLNDDGKVRESRAIAHDTDTLLLIRKVKKKKGSTEEPHENDREIFCPKNRGGKKNWWCAVRLNGEYFKFNPRTA